VYVFCTYIEKTVQLLYNTVAIELQEDSIFLLIFVRRNVSGPTIC